MFSRRRFNTSVGAGLLLAPFLSQLSQRPAQAAGKRAKRVLLFCTMGTSPDLWTPTGVSGETTFTLTPSTQPLEAIRQHLVLVDGLVSANPGDNHGSPDALTGLGFQYSGQPTLISVDQFLGDRLAASGINRPIATLLLGAETNGSGGKTMFNRGQQPADHRVAAERVQRRVRRRHDAVRRRRSDAGAAPEAPQERPRSRDGRGERSARRARRLRARQAGRPPRFAPPGREPPGPVSGGRRDDGGRRLRQAGDDARGRHDERAHGRSLAHGRHRGRVRVRPHARRGPPVRVGPDHVRQPAPSSGCRERSTAPSSTAAAPTSRASSSSSSGWRSASSIS